MNKNTDQSSRDVIITDEGKATLQKYMKNLNEVYTDMDFSKSEIQEIITEMNEHIYHLAGFYAGEGTPITSDHVLRAIKKLGDPDVIKRTLVSDDEIIRELSPPKEEDQRMYKRKNIEMTVSNTIAFYQFLSWIVTFCSFMFLFYRRSVYLWTPYPFYLLVTYFLLVKASPAYSNNKRLQESVRINFHMFFYPLIHFYFALYYGYNSLHDPLLITIILYILSKEWKTIVNGLRNFVEESQKRTRELKG